MKWHESTLNTSFRRKVCGAKPNGCFRAPKLCENTQMWVLDLKECIEIFQVVCLESYCSETFNQTHADCSFCKGKFPARPSNKSRFLLWPCKIATSLFDPDFIFLPFHGPAVTFAVNSQLKWLWKDNSTPGAQTTDIEISWRTDIGDVQHDIMQQILHIFNTLDSRTI